MLCESVRDDNPWCYSLWPDIELDYQTYDYNEHESSVVATLQLLKKAALPIDTYILAVLLIQRLAHPSLPDESVPSLSRTNGTDFYDRWFNHRLTKIKRRQQEQPREAPTKEVIIIAGLVSSLPSTSLTNCRSLPKSSFMIRCIQWAHGPTLCATREKISPPTSYISLSG